MIDVKKAIQAASDYLRYIYDPGPTDIRLEEVWLADGPPQEWQVTLSFMVFIKREYKLLQIDANTGDVKGMRMRQIA